MLHRPSGKRRLLCARLLCDTPSPMPILLSRSVSEHGAPCLELRHTEPISYRYSRVNWGSVCGQQVLAANIPGQNSGALERARRVKETIRTTPTGLPDVAVFAGVLHQGFVACRRQRTSQIGTPDQWGKQVRGVKGNVDAMGMLIRQLGASPEKAKHPCRSNTFS